MKNTKNAVISNKTLLGNFYPKLSSDYVPQYREKFSLEEFAIEYHDLLQNINRENDSEDRFTYLALEYLRFFAGYDMIWTIMRKFATTNELRAMLETEKNNAAYIEIRRMAVKDLTGFLQRWSEASPEEINSNSVFLNEVMNTFFYEELFKKKHYPAVNKLFAKGLVLFDDEVNFTLNGKTF